MLFVLAVALTATGFAHRMPAQQDGAQSGAQSASQSVALAFALANGAGASDFCGGGPGSDRSSAPHCPACQISAAADLPPLSTPAIDLALAVHADVVASRAARAIPAVQDPAHSPQGPPVA